jgi:hypothetical protein
MQNESEIAFADYQHARAELQHYYHNIDRGGFRYGSNDYPPFLSVNGVVGGPFADMMESIGNDLGVKAIPTRCHWDDFAERLAREEFATVAAPIMPIHVRAFQIIPLVELHCGALFFSSNLGNKQTADLRHHTRRVLKSLQEIDRLEAGALASYRFEEIDNNLRSMANIGKGFAAGKVFFEQLLLQRFNAPIARELPGPSLAEDSQEAAQENYLCAVDLVTIRQIEEKIGRDAFVKKYDYLPLLGRYIPVPAGLPFVEQDIGTYLWYRWRHEESSPIAQALEILAANGGKKYSTRLGFSILNRSTLPMEMEDATLTTRNAEYYERVSRLLNSAYQSLHATQLGSDGARLQLLSGGPSVGAASLPILSDRMEDLQTVLMKLEEESGGDLKVRTVREVIHEESTARNYIQTRYRNLINRKHLNLLRESEVGELEELVAALDEMDELFYEKIIAKLQKALEMKRGEG